MATTFSVSDLVSTQFDRPIWQTLVKLTTWASGVTTPNSQGGEDTIYKYVGGANPLQPASIRVGNYPPVKPGQNLNMSSKLRATILKTDGDGVESYLPIEVVVAVSDGSLGLLSRADVAELITLAASALIHGTSAVSGTISVKALDAIARGATDVLPLIPDPTNVAT